MKTFFAIFVFSCSVGCGTMANLDGKELAFISAPGQRKPELYGGLKNDIRWGSLFLLETPVSLVADTLTIPAVLHKQRKWEENQEPVVADLRHGDHVCPVHGYALRSETIPVTWGTRSLVGEYLFDRNRKFPYANTDLWLRSPDNIEYAVVDYCSKCRSVEQEWERNYDPLHSLAMHDQTNNTQAEVKTFADGESPLP